MQDRLGGGGVFRSVTLGTLGVRWWVEMLVLEG